MAIIGETMGASRGTFERNEVDVVALAGLPICVNGLTQTLYSETLAELLVELGFGPGPVATALNGTFVPVGKRGAATLVAGDRIEVVTARQGG